MIIKETPWEKRNLGVSSSVEFYFEQTDNEENLDKSILNNTMYSYQVAHIPVGRINVLNRLLENGFQFFETKIKLTADLKNLSLPCVFQRFCNGMAYHEAGEDDIQKIYHLMGEGIFSTDKVALDSAFNARIAGQRYAHWTADEIKAGRAFAYIVTNGREDIGFFVLKRLNERLGDSFLAGLFDKEKNSGLGFSVLYFPMAEARHIGLKKIITGVSSNNPDSVKVHLALGYQIQNMDYTLVKHI